MGSALNWEGRAARCSSTTGIRNNCLEVQQHQRCHFISHPGTLHRKQPQGCCSLSGLCRRGGSWEEEAWDEGRIPLDREPRHRRDRQPFTAPVSRVAEAHPAQQLSQLAAKVWLCRTPQWQSSTEAALLCLSRVHFCTFNPEVFTLLLFPPHF